MTTKEHVKRVERQMAALAMPPVPATPPPPVQCRCKACGGAIAQLRAALAAANVRAKDQLRVVITPTGSGGTVSPSLGSVQVDGRVIYTFRADPEREAADPDLIADVLAELNKEEAR